MRVIPSIVLAVTLGAAALWARSEFIQDVFDVATSVGTGRITSARSSARPGLTRPGS